MKTPTTIMFYSYKGGAGRSLLVANYALFLSHCGKRVAVIDCDIEAPGLHHKFAEPPRTITSTNALGLIDYVLFFQDNDEASGDIGMYFSEVRSPGSPAPIYLMPAGNAPSEDYCSKVLALDWRKLFPEHGVSEGVGLFRFLKKQIVETYEPDFILIDSRTGVTDIGSVAITSLADVYVCLFLCNPENQEGSRRMLSAMRSYAGNDGRKVFPVLSRIAPAWSGEESALKQVRKRLGDVWDDGTPFILHEDASLHIVEELLFGSNKTLGESTLLRDYFKLFNALDSETARSSKYFELREYLPSTGPRLDKDASSGLGIDNQVMRNIQDREQPKLRYVPYAYARGDEYGRLVNFIKDELCANESKALGVRVLLDDTIKEEDTHWDTISLQIRNGLIDFCSEAYYLTASRALSLGVIQIGWLRTFTCVLHRSIYEELASSVYNSFEEFIKHVKDAYGNIEVGVMGENAATDEAASVVARFSTPTSLQFRKTPKELSDWLQRCPEKQLIVCDHSLAKRVAECYPSKGDLVYAENGSPGGNYSRLIFQFEKEKDIRVGFLHLKEDSKWRYLINQSLASVLLSNPGIWGTKESKNCVAGNLWNAGIDPLSENELIREIVLGMTPVDAAEWLSHLGSRRR